MTKADLLTRIKEKIGTGSTHYAGCESDHILCACYKLIAGLDDRDLLTIAEIRIALGVNEKVMLSELLDEVRKIRRNATRYEEVRQLSPQEFLNVWVQSRTGKETFDQIVDARIDTPAGNKKSPDALLTSGLKVSGGFLFFRMLATAFVVALMKPVKILTGVDAVTHPLPAFWQGVIPFEKCLRCTF